MPLHAVYAPLCIYRPTHVNRSDGRMKEGYALVLLLTLQKARYSTSFGRRTAHESRIEELPHVEVPQKVRQIGLTKIESVGAVRYQHAGTG